MSDQLIPTPDDSPNNALHPPAALTGPLSELLEDSTYLTNLDTTTAYGLRMMSVCLDQDSAPPPLQDNGVLVVSHYLIGLRSTTDSRSGEYWKGPALSLITPDGRTWTTTSVVVIKRFLVFLRCLRVPLEQAPLTIQLRLTGERPRECYTFTVLPTPDQPPNNPKKGPKQ